MKLVRLAAGRPTWRQKRTLTDSYARYHYVAFGWWLRVPLPCATCNDSGWITTSYPGGPEFDVSCPDCNDEAHKW